MVQHTNFVVNVEHTLRKLWEKLENKMGLKTMIKKYKDYETKELGRRAAKKKKIAPYKSLANKKCPSSCIRTTIPRRRTPNKYISI